MAIYIMWNIWKERNRIMFQNQTNTPQEVSDRVIEDIQDRK